MTRPPPEVRALGRMLLESASESPKIEERLEATQRVLVGLATRLSPLVGEGGFHLLLQRALKRSQADHPWVRAIAPDATGPLAWPGLAEAVDGVEPEEVAAGTETAIAELIGLVSKFLGADMTIRILSQSFPEVLGGAGKGSGPQETTS